MLERGKMECGVFEIAPFPISRTRKSEKKLNEFLMIPRPA